MATTIDLIVCVIVDADGNYSVGTDEENAKDAYENDVGNDDTTAKRLIKLTIRVLE